MIPVCASSDTHNPAFRKPFIPPTSETPLVVRSISYGGEEHPVTVKRALTVAVSQLPLKDKHAIHKFCLLAGVRWTPTPPKNSGIKFGESAEHGYVKISCEDFPEPAMNLKWVSDRLDDLINEANVRYVCFFLISNLGLREAHAERGRSLQRYSH